MSGCATCRMIGRAHALPKDCPHLLHRQLEGLGDLLRPMATGVHVSNHALPLGGELITLAHVHRLSRCVGRGRRSPESCVNRSTTDTRLQVFVVHEPVLGVARFAPWLRVAVGNDVPKAAQLLENPNVQHYWNPTGAFGSALRSTEFPHLDSGVFAQQVQTLLAQLPPAAGTLADQAHP